MRFCFPALPRVAASLTLPGGAVLAGEQPAAQLAELFAQNCWRHERILSPAKEIVGPADGEVKVDFTLGFGALPKC